MNSWLQALAGASECYGRGWVGEAWGCTHSRPRVNAAENPSCCTWEGLYAIAGMFPPGNPGGTGRSAKRCDVDHCVSSVLGHCALRTRCIRQLELRRSWQPKRNFVFNLRPSRRDEGHVLSKYSGRPNRSFRTHFLVFWRVDISLKPSASSDTRRDATNSLKLVTVRNLTRSRKTLEKTRLG